MLNHFLEILADRESGASEIECRLAKTWLAEKPEDEQGTLDRITDVVLERYPAMANLLDWLDTMWRLLEADDATRRARLRRWLVERLEDVERAPLEIGRRLVPLLAERPIVFTLSRSSTLLGALAAARQAGGRPHVRVAESRPQSEGLLMAADLVGQGIETTVLPDFSLASLLGGFRPRGLGLAASAAESMLVVGTDGIAPGHFINKAGTAALALVARRAGVPVIVVAGPGKLLPDRLAPVSEIGAEPWDAGRGGVPGRRFDFERVANKQVDHFVLPDGVVAPPALAERIAERPISRHLAARLARME